MNIRTMIFIVSKRGKYEIKSVTYMRTLLAYGDWSTVGNRMGVINGDCGQFVRVMAPAGVWRRSGGRRKLTS